MAKKRQKRRRKTAPRRYIAGSGDIPKNEDAQTVASVPDKHKRPQLSVGKPQPIVLGSMRSKVANIGAGGSGFGGGGIGGPGSGNTGAFGSGLGSVGGSAIGSGGNFYSPELSTDFLELPQSLDEQRNYFRFFYRADPFVGQAMDIHRELPLSKIRLGRPEAKDKDLAQQSLDFCKRWTKIVGLLQRLSEGLHEYNVIGETHWFIEDDNPDMPEDVRYEIKNILHEDGNLEETKELWPDADERASAWMKKNYKGWTQVRILPPEQIHMDSFPMSDEILVSLIPDSKTKSVIEQADQGDQRAVKVMESMPPDIVMAVRHGENVPLNTDPDAGSFYYYMANKVSQYEPRGHSRLERCIRTLVYKDKLRQAQTSISSRHMTPIRLVYAENMNEADTEALRDQIDLALQDPDYSIVTNFQVTWEEMTPQGRLLELSSEYDLINRELYAGLGVTESLLSGESSYSGDRINLEVINVRYMLVREFLQDFVEKNLFEPMCRRMGFIETDDWGNDVVVCPKLSFTRLALRDNQDVYDALFNLYQKGSLPISVIYDLLNVDGEGATEELQRDFATFKDPTYNEVLRGLYSQAGTKLGDQSNFVEKQAEYLGLDYKEEAEGMQRFGSQQAPSQPQGQPAGMDVLASLVAERIAGQVADLVADKIVEKLQKRSPESTE